ncbi:MAG: hypothetical protein WDO24_02855 [Pseudomonadota bacterium]
MAQAGMAPAAATPTTLPRKPSRRARALVEIGQHLRAGTLLLILPSGERMTFRGHRARTGSRVPRPARPDHAALSVRRPSGVRRSPCRRRLG